MATQSQRTANSVPELAPERQVRWPKRTKSQLANGLEIILLESHSIPKFRGELYFRSGNASAASRGTALAEMAATMVRTGTSQHSSREIEEHLRGLGADLSVSAGQDNSSISFAGLSDHAEPGFLAGERLRKVLFGEHPYSQISPTEEQVAAYTREELQSVYRDFYTPENAILILVGDFDSATMQKSAERVFGNWSGSKPAAPESVKPPVPKGRRVYLVDLPGSVQTQILCGCHAITRKHPHWIKLGLTNSLYGGAFNSRLVMNIREDKGYTYSPRSGVNPLRQYGYFSVSAAVRNDVVAASLTEIFYEIDKLRSLPVPEAELLDAQNYLTGVFSMGLATQSGLLSQISTLALNDLPDDYLETYREKVRALKPEDVLFAARTYFDSANMQIVVVGDRKQIESQAALFGDCKIFSAAGAQFLALS